MEPTPANGPRSLTTTTNRECVQKCVYKHFTYVYIYMYIYLCANSSTSEKSEERGWEKEEKEKDKWKFRKASIEAVRG